MTGSQLALASRTGCKWANHAHLRCKLLQGSDSIFGRRMSREQIVHSLPGAGIDNEQMRSCGILFGWDILDLMYSYVDLRQWRYPVTRSLDLEILRRRFSAVAYDLELDLLAFIERGKTRPLHSRCVHKHIDAAAASVSRSVLDSAFAGLTLDGAVLAFDRRQRGTFRKSFEEYSATRVIPTRIKRAKQLMQRHAALLARIERHSECRLRCSWPSGLSKATTAPAIWASCP